MQPGPGRANQVAGVLELLGADTGVGVLLVGAAGVGKSHLVRLVSDQLVRSGQRVIRVVGAGPDDAPFGALERVCMQVADAGAAPSVVFTRMLRVSEQPNVILVDDVDAVDAASLAAVMDAAEAGFARLLATIGGDDIVPYPVERCLTSGSLARFICQPLGRVESAALAEEFLGAPLSRSAARTIHELSDGRPLVIREIVAAAQDEGVLEPTEHGAALREVPVMSGRLIDLVDRRLCGVDADQLDVLRRLAIVGEGGPSELAAFVDERVLVDLEERELVATVLDGRRLGVTVSSLLVAAVLRSTAPGLVTRRIRSEHAQVLRSLGARRASDRLRLATWALDGVGAVDAGVLSEAARMAGSTADHVLSQRLAEAAFAAEPSFDSGRLVAVRQYAASDFDALKQHLPVWERLVSDADQRAVFESTSTNAWYWRGFDEWAIDRLIAIHDEWPHGPARHQAQSTSASLMVTTGRIDAAIALAEDLGELPPGPPAVLTAMALGHGARARAKPLTAAAGVAAALDLYRTFGPDAYVLSDTAMAGLHIQSLAEAGRFAELDVIIADRSDSWSDTGESQSAALAHLAAGFSWFLRGEYDRALTFAAEASYGFEATRLTGMIRWAKMLQALGHAERGDVVAARQVLDELDATRDHPAQLFAASLARARAWTAHHANDPAQARELLGDAFDRALVVGNIAAAIDCLHDLARQGDPLRAADGLRRIALDEVEGRWHATRIEHIRAAALGEVAALERCMFAFDQFQCRHLAAACALAAAAAPVTTPAEAKRWLREAKQRSTDVVTRSLAEWPLTAREREVAQLAITGLTSRQIADRLGNSRRTIDTHLGSVYAKLGVDGRTGLIELIR